MSVVICFITDSNFIGKNTCCTGKNIYLLFRYQK